MHFALIIDDYLPHSTRVGAKMYHDLAKELIQQGHQVTVITPHFDKHQSRLLESSLEGVTVWRFYSGQIKDVPKVTRAVNETLLSYNAWRAVKGKINKHTFDGVVYYSPSIFFGSLVSKIKKRCLCSSYLVLRDFFPQWAIDSDLIRAGSLIEQYFRYFEKQSYKVADTIGVMSERNLEIFYQATASRYPSEILRNWASLTPHQMNYEAIDLRAQLSLTDEVIFFYGGNIGHAQDMTNLMRLAKGMQRYTKAHFLFVGQGDEVELIKTLADDWELDNFSYLPSVNQEVFKDILAQVDVGLFSLSAKHTAHNFPGKLLGYMVQSLPILGSVNQGNDLIELVNVNSAGLITVNGDDEQFLINAVNLLEDASYRSKVGRAGYRLLKEEFAVYSIASTIISKLEGHRN
ncbi:glycosyltransferase family 4 protein [Vibrio mediterranei]|uniref:Glycosyltransferase WbuB n=1 Tax=Vibrio mediterranei TaxID=689 RepID=A0ABX5DFE3_9VIBR|nr:glycosyltransferase family 4 protein [Vibrio mediterranei]PCD87707.1 glycosyltransferase WbuB [Vibrio mediterranei]PRQ67331.1 glycosyltransferase WbuB [Vibrio mediterranei]